MNISVRGGGGPSALSGPLYRGPSACRNSQAGVTAIGSGVIVDAQGGYVVAANHVCQASTAQVTTKDGRRFVAKLIGRDRH